MSENFIIAVLALWAVLAILFLAEGMFRVCGWLYKRLRAIQQRPSND